MEILDAIYSAYDQLMAFLWEDPLTSVLVAAGVFVGLLIALLIISAKRTEEDELEKVEQGSRADERRLAVKEAKAQASPQYAGATVGADGELRMSAGGTVNDRYSPLEPLSEERLTARHFSDRVLQLTEDFDNLMDKLEEQVEEKEAQVREREQKLERLERQARALDSNIDQLEDEQEAYERLSEEDKAEIAAVAAKTPYPMLFWITFVLLLVETAGGLSYYFLVLAK